jgi:nucleotide-binding universal stress UspA family protein
MRLWRSILAATDLSDAADEAIGQAHEQAQLCRARLRVLHVLPTWPGTPMEPAGVERELLDRERLSREIFDTITKRVESIVGASGGELDIVLDEGLASGAILRQAEAMDADLVVVGDGGQQARSGVRRVLGTVADAVVRTCRCSVMVARPRAGTHRVICAVDFSESSLAAARAAAALQLARAGELYVIHARAPDEPASEASERLERAVAELGHGIARLVIGAPATVIPALAADERADAIVIGTTGRTGVRSLGLGSVAQAIAHNAPCSVLVVRELR